MTEVDGTLVLKLMTLPRGEGAPVRKLGRMRNGDMFHIYMHFVKKVHWERLYRLNGPRWEWEGVAIPHPPLRGPPSPRGKVLFRRLCKHQFIGQLRKTDVHNILYLRSLRLRRRATAKGCLL